MDPSSKNWKINYKNCTSCRTLQQLSLSLSLSLSHTHTHTHTHRAYESLLALREVYGEQVIIRWPPWSLDLNLCGLYVYYMLEDKVLSTKYTTEDVKNIFKQSFWTFQKKCFVEYFTIWWYGNLTCKHRDIVLNIFYDWR